MLHWSLVFLVIAIIAAVLGFSVRNLYYLLPAARRHLTYVPDRLDLL